MQSLRFKETHMFEFLSKIKRNLQVFENFMAKKDSRYDNCC